MNAALALISFLAGIAVTGGVWWATSRAQIGERQAEPLLDWWEREL